MPNDSGRSNRRDLPRLPAALLRALLPHAEREEVIGDLAAEYGARVRSSGRVAASVWLWRQVLTSVPALARRGWWRGWSGFSPSADWGRPGGAPFEGWAMDVRYTLRRLGRRPGYTVLAVLTLSLGVGGTAAVYAIAQRLLLGPLPVATESEVAVFWGGSSWSEAEFLHLRAELDGSPDIAAFWRMDMTLQRGDAPAALVEVASASSNLFRVLGAGPAIGPGFRPGDDVPGAEPVAVLSHSLWRELGGDPSIIGQRLDFAGMPRTVVGVMPPGFWFPDPMVQVWLSARLNPEEAMMNYRLIGRFPGGMGTAEVRSHVDRITALLGGRFTYVDQWDKTRDARLTPLREHLVGSFEPALIAMLGAMALILLIACVNVAALMLGQVDSRGTELAVRTALGASRRRLLRQIVIETATIGVLAGLTGAAVALVVFPLLVGALPLGALAEAVTPDWILFWSGTAFAVLAATVAALAPAASVARYDIRPRLARGGTAGVARRGGGLERTLVVTQVALVLVMAAGAALLIRSVANLRAIDPGMETAGLGVIDIVVPATTPMPERSRAIHEVVEAVETLPGVASAAATQRLPLRGSGHHWGIRVESRPELEVTTAAFRLVTPEYLETMGMRLRAGRGLLETDALLPDEGVVVVNAALADHYFSGRDPIGQRIAFSGRPWNRIVGVIENVAESELTAAPEPARYLLFEHAPGGINIWQTVVFRTQDRRDPVGLLDAARRAIQTTAPTVAVREATTMGQVVDRAIGPARPLMALLSLLGGLGLLLGAVGVYGVVSHFVTRGRRDWSIRIALGLRPASVVGRIVGGAGALVGAGVALGLLVFFFLARLLASFLYHVAPADVLALGGATAVLLLAGLLAAYLPARRAARLDPATILREE